MAYRHLAYSPSYIPDETARGGGGRAGEGGEWVTRGAWEGGEEEARGHGHAAEPAGRASQSDNQPPSSRRRAASPLPLERAHFETLKVAVHERCSYLCHYHNSSAVLLKQSSNKMLLTWRS